MLDFHFNIASLLERDICLKFHLVVVVEITCVEGKLILRECLVHLIEEICIRVMIWL